MSDSGRPGITPRSWSDQRHQGVLHLGKRWYVVHAELEADGQARGVRLDGPYAGRREADEAAARR